MMIDAKEAYKIAKNFFGIKKHPYTGASIELASCFELNDKFVFYWTIGGECPYTSGHVYVMKDAGEVGYGATTRAEEKEFDNANWFDIESLKN